MFQRLRTQQVSHRAAIVCLLAVALGAIAFLAGTAKDEPVSTWLGILAMAAGLLVCAAILVAQWRQNAEGQSARRWLQFSLRTMFIVMTVSAVGSAYLGVHLRRGWAQQDALDALAALKERGAKIASCGASTPPWRTVVVDCQGTPTTDADLGLFKHLDGPTSVYLQDTEITDRGLEYLGDLPTLDTIRLSNTAITDEGVSHLQRLSNLKSLDLSRTRISDAGLEQLTSLTNLEELTIDETQVTDAGLRHLKAFPKLKSLWLDPQQATPRGLAHLKGLPNLHVGLCRRTGNTHSVSFLGRAEAEEKR